MKKPQRKAGPHRRRIAAVLSLFVMTVNLYPATVGAVEVPPPGAPLFIQTSGPNAGLNVGDWYSSPGGGNTDHIFTIHVPPDWPVATPVTVALYDPESIGPDPASPSAADEVRGGVGDSATYELRDPGAGTLVTTTYSGAATNGQWVSLYTFSPALSGSGDYELHVTVSDDDDNSWRLAAYHDPDCTVGAATCTPGSGNEYDDADGVAGTGDELDLSIERSSFQHEGSGQPCNEYFFFVGPSTPRPMFAHNFDMDGAGSVVYNDPTGGTQTGAVSGGTVWNNGGSATTRAGDQLADLEGWWSATICIDSNNQYVFEAPAGSLTHPDYQPGYPLLSITKDNGLSTVTPGQTLNYTIAFANTSDATTTPGQARDLEITDVVPAGTSYVGCAITAPLTGSCGEVGGTVTWLIDQAIDAGDGGVVTLTVDVAGGATGTISNTAMLTFNDALGNAHSPVSAMDSDPVIVPSLAITKSSDAGGTVVAGQTVGYTVTVTNTATQRQTGITLTDLITGPAGHVAGSTVVTREANTKTVRDNFASAALDNNDGADVWAAAWSEFDTTGSGPSSGNITINGGELRLDDQPDSGTDPWIARTADFTDYTGVTLTYDYRTVGWLESTDTIVVEVSADGSAWTTLATYTDTVSGSASHDITTWASEDTAVRFRVDDAYGGWGEAFLVDFAQITGNLAQAEWAEVDLVDGAPPNLVLPADGIELGAGETLTATLDADVLTLLDGTATELTNTATVTSTEEPTPESEAVTDDIDFQPVLTATKGGPATAGLGDLVTYTFSVGHDAASDGSPVMVAAVIDDVAGAAVYASGDTNTDDLLDSGETWVYEATYTITATDPDPLVNTVTVTGSDADGDAITDATDDHTLDIDHTPALAVSKSGPGVAQVGEVVTYTFMVLHDAGSDGSPVTVGSVVDDIAGTAVYVSGDTNSDGLLDADETWVYEATYTITGTDPDPLLNTVTVTGTDNDGDAITPAGANHSTDIVFPAIDLQKTASPLIVLEGDVVTFTITVTNSGETTMTDVTVTDATAPACDNVIGVLTPGASASYDCTVSAGAADFSNEATVTALDPLRSILSDLDIETVQVIHPSVDVEKTPDVQTVLPGSDVDFTITITNTGDRPLTTLIATDLLVPDCTASLPNLPPGQTTSYTCTAPNVTASFTNTILVVGNHPASGTTFDIDTADVIVIAPGIDIEKTPDTQTIVSGDDAVFTITVTNTGGVDLDNVTVSDPLAPDCDAALGSLTAGAATSYSCTVTAATAGFTNTAAVSGDGPLGNPWTDSDDAVVTVVSPDVTLSKVADTPQILPGDPVSFTITVSNTGDRPLIDLDVVDPLSPDCDTLIPFLAVGDATTYSCTTTAPADDFTNTATVTGTDDLLNQVSDSDSAAIDVIHPGVSVAKDPASQQVVTGDTVSWAITVTNTGDVDLVDVTVSDPLVPDCDAALGPLAAGASSSYGCSLANVTADFTNTASVTGDDPLGDAWTDSDTAVVDVIDPGISITKGPASQQVVTGGVANFTITVRNTGDVDLDNVAVSDPLVSDCDTTLGTLAAGASSSYGCSLANVTADFTNTASVAGDDPLGDAWTGSDTADVTVLIPGIDISKTPNSQQAHQGDTVTFTVTVVNTGDTTLDDVTVTDPVAPDCDTTIGTMAPGASTIDTCTMTAGAADYINTASVSGDDPFGNPWTASDDAAVDVINPAISITKAPDTQQVVTAGTATWTITVTNTGDVDLSNVTVTDPLAPNCAAAIGNLDAGASTSSTCDLAGITAAFTNTASVSAQDVLGTVVGDSDSADVTVLVPAIDVDKVADTPVIVTGGTADFTITITNTGPTILTGVTVADPLAPDCNAAVGDLAPGATTSYACQLSGETDDFTNTATATGTDPLGTTWTNSATADVDVIHPDLTITKAPASQQVVTGGAAAWTITVTNTGDVDLTGVAVADPLAPGCSAFIGLLAAGDFVTSGCSLSNVTADFTNTATATGTGPLGGSWSDSDTAYVDVIDPSLTIDKTPVGQMVLAGGTASFTITVTNTGDVSLTDVTVSDPLAPNCDATFATLAGGASTSYGCDLANVVSDFTNTAAVAGDDPLGNPWTDSDTAVVDLVAPAIDIEKTPDLQNLLAGEDALFTITVSNTGDVTLTNVTVSDALAPDCDATIGDLNVGDSSSYTCTLAGVSDDLSNVAVATGEHGAGGSVTDSDDAHVDVLDPQVDIQKTPDLQQVTVGGTASFTITVTNAGVVPLSDVTVSDPQAPKCDAAIGSLAVGASTSYPCTLIVGSTDFTNTATVDATDAVGNPSTDSDGADVDVIAPVIAISKTPNLQSVVWNGTASFTVEVTNTGDVDLSNVVVSDANAPGCGATIPTLLVGDSATTTCTVPGVTAGFTNIASVTADHPAGGSVTNSDNGVVAVLVPAVEIQKTPDNQQVITGGDATFTITVTNSGETDLGNVVVTDTLVPDCDASFGTLAVGESTSYSCTAAGVAADFTNTADVTAADPIGGTWSDSDTADVDVIEPNISISKTPNLQNVVSGGTAHFTVTVGNVGDVDLTNVVINDPNAPACDATFTDLAVGASEVVTCDVASVTADFTNVATVTADAPLGNQVTDSDDALVDVVEPGVTIAKTPDTQQAREGDIVSFTVTVTNSGSQDLVDLTVADPVAPGCDTTIASLGVGEATSYDCTMTAPSDDVTNIAYVAGTDDLANPVSDSDDAFVDVIHPAITVDKTPDSQTVISGGVAEFTITVTNTGDVDLTDVTVSDPLVPGCDTDVGDLDVGASASYDCSVSGVTAAFTNTANVTGTDPTDQDVTDTDTAGVTVIVPAVDIQKGPALQQVRVGETSIFTITVTNAGATDLTGVTVSDTLAPDCDRVLGDLAQGASSGYSCTLTVGGSDFVNTASVTATDPIGGTWTDDDDATIDVIAPAVTISKSPDGQAVPLGGDATFTIEVTNTGDVDLTGVTVTDPAVSACDLTIGALATGASATYTCTASGVTADFNNTATVTGTDPLGLTVGAADTAEVTVLEPGITIDKNPAAQTVLEGEAATFTIVVANTGEVALNNVTVSDPLAPDCGSVIGTLGVGASPVSYTCTVLPTADFTNTATVTAADPVGAPVSDSDTADVTVLLLGDLSGTVGYDIAADGSIAGDPGLSGIGITATWFGFDGIEGTGDDRTYTTTTNGAGAYAFSGLPPGDHRIDVASGDLPAGLDSPTLDPDGTADSTTVVAVPEAGATTGVDFGYTGTGSVGDLVWLDVDGDGTRDAGEPGLGAIGLTLTWAGQDGILGNGDDVTQTTASNGSGAYGFSNLPAGDFEVAIDGGTIPAGTGGDLDRDVALAAAEARNDVDFPLTGTGTIGDFAFRDINGNGLEDPGEPGVPGVTVLARWPGPDGTHGTGDDLLLETSTDAAGRYLFELLPAGDYAVTLDVGTYDPALGTAPTLLPTLGAGETNLAVDFPLVGNLSPVAEDDVAAIEQGIPVVVEVLGNDTDPEGHTLEVASATDGANGTVIVNADGTVTYTPKPAFRGEDTFTYQACEAFPFTEIGIGGVPATGLCDTATVTVVVDGPPLIGQDSGQIAVIGDPLDPITLPEDDMIVTQVGGELPPGVTLNDDGSFSGSPTEVGEWTVTVRACDATDPDRCMVVSHTITAVVGGEQLPNTGADIDDLAGFAFLLILNALFALLLTRKREEDPPVLG